MHLKSVSALSSRQAALSQPWWQAENTAWPHRDISRAWCAAPQSILPPSSGGSPCIGTGKCLVSGSTCAGLRECVLTCLPCNVCYINLPANRLGSHLRASFVETQLLLPPPFPEDAWEPRQCCHSGQGEKSRTVACELARCSMRSEPPKLMAWIKFVQVSCISHNSYPFPKRYYLYSKNKGKAFYN